MYTATITRINKLSKHPNADRLQIAEMHGCQVIVGLDTDIGDLGIFFPEDGIINLDFLLANKALAKHPLTGEKLGGFFDEKGRVRAQLFRGARSEGFWCPISYLMKWAESEKIPFPDFTEGREFSTVGELTLCEKFINPRVRMKKGESTIPKLKVAKSRFSCPMQKHIDTPSFKSLRVGGMEEGDMLVVSYTTKLHGTSGRSSLLKNPAYVVPTLLDTWKQDFLAWAFKDKKIWPTLSIFGIDWIFLFMIMMIFDAAGAKPIEPYYKWYHGTRNTTFDLIRGHSSYRAVAAERLEEVMLPGETWYYEIVGYDGQSTIQGGHNASSCNKEMQKLFPGRVNYSYGCRPNQSEIYVYRINMDGQDLPFDQIMKRCKEHNINHVPRIQEVVFQGTSDGQESYIHNVIDDMRKKVNTDKPSILDARHPEEGIVIRIDWFRNGMFKSFAVFKDKSFVFKVMEGLAKDSGIVEDIEEEESLIEET